MEVPRINTAINYISQAEMKQKITDEIYQNIPEAIPFVCEAAHIPPEYRDKVKELIITELNSVLDMLDCKDMITILEPMNRWSSHAEALRWFKEKYGN